MNYYAIFDKHGKLSFVTPLGSVDGIDLKKMKRRGQSLHQVTLGWVNANDIGELGAYCEPLAHGVHPGKTISPHQRKLFKYIESYWQEHSLGPSIQEMADYMGHSSISAAHDMVGRLIRSGWVTRDRGVARSVKVVI